MDPEDEIAKKTHPPYSIGQPLAEMSVEEIEQTIASLQAEIERLTEAKEGKIKHLSAAQALFKSS